MVSRLLKILSVIVAVANIAGCKVTVMVPPSGDVTSRTGSRDCAAGTRCEFNVTDKTFSESFTAVAKPGYAFNKWKAGPGFLCGNSTNPTCIVDNTITAEEHNAVVDAVIAGESVFYAMPLFETIGSTSDANLRIADHGDLIVPDTTSTPVGNSGKYAKATVGNRQRLGVFGKAITRARYPNPMDGPPMPDSKRSMASNQDR